MRAPAALPRAAPQPPGMDRPKTAVEEKPRILVADDDPGIRDVLQRRLASVSQVAALGAQMKKYAKAAKRSYVFDRREA